MADIFISYSRKDSEQALKLADKLRRVGVNVWIDQQGLEGSSSWSQEIVEQIDVCSVFLLLLSNESQCSQNVLKEVSIAYDAHRSILPVDLEFVALNQSLRYHLAGIQRVPLIDFDAIIRALKRLGVADSAPSTISPLETKSLLDTRTSLLVLPFEYLSPNLENAWFADGLTVELIDTLSNIKSLRLIDRQTSMDLKNFRGTTLEIAKALQVRFFIEVTVRKFGDQIKISIQLLDIEKNEYLWQDSYKGKFEDVFEIQEAVSNKVVNGLKLHLTKTERVLLHDRGTTNPVAYELVLQSDAYLNRFTREGFGHAIQLLNHAIQADPMFATAYHLKGYVLAAIYHVDGRDATLLIEAEALVQKALQLKPTLWKAYHALSMIYLLQGKLEAGENLAQQYVERAPEDYLSYSGLGFYYFNIGEYAKAIRAYEHAIGLNPTDLGSLWNLVNACQGAKDHERLVYWASRTLPHVERHLMLHPDDDNQRVTYANLLSFAGRVEEARIAAASLEAIGDGGALNDIACLWARLGEAAMAAKTIRRAVEAGFLNMRLLTEFLEDDMAQFRGTPEYEETAELVRQLGVIHEMETVNQRVPDA